MGRQDHEALHELDGIKPSTSPTTVRIILIASFGSFMFGYANNVIAGTLAQTSFGVKFLSGSNADSIIGGILGVYYGGGLIGTILHEPVSNRYGRKAAQYAAGVLLLLSGALQSGSVHIAMFMIARFICGLGSGIVITNSPVYMSEVSPPHNRGLLTSMHAFGLVFAYILSSIMALAFHFVETAYSWRLQFVLLTFFSFCFLVSIYFIPESPRWLCEKQKYDDAWKVLQSIHRSKSDPEAKLAQFEMSQIRTQVDAERDLPKGYWYIFTTPSLRKRAIISILVWCMGQGSGVLVVANLTPLLFGALGYGVVDQLGLSVAWVTVAIVCITLGAFVMDRVGRVKLLVIGGYSCAVVMAIEGALQKYYLDTTYKPGLNAAVAFFFIFIVFYGIFIDSAAYVYVPEIWPTHLRSHGSAIGLVSFFANTIAYNSPASTAFATIGWEYYMVFVAAATVFATLIAFLAPETSRLSLEEISVKFGDEVDYDTTSQHEKPVVESAYHAEDRAE